MVLSRPKSHKFSLRPWRCYSDVYLDSLPPSSRTSLFMVFLICPDGIPPCAHPVIAWIGRVMMRVVPYKTNISWRKKARETSRLLGRLACIWGGKLSPACVVSNNTGNEYDNEGLVGLIRQSCSNQVKWHVLWKASRLSWCKRSRDMDRRNTIKCSYK